MNLRSLMFQNVYMHPEAKKEEQKAIRMLTKLYEYYIDNPEQMSREYQELIKRGEPVSQAVCDYLSGMTDQYSMEKFRQILSYRSPGRAIKQQRRMGNALFRRYH